MSTGLSKVAYWFDKLPELQSNIEPLTQLMIRTAGEAHYFIKQRKVRHVIGIVNTKDINLLHSIDRTPDLEKLKKRVDYLKENKNEILALEKEHGHVDLSSDFFINSPFASINAELVAKVSKDKYVTLSGVGRIGAFKIAFPGGIKVKIEIGKKLDKCLAKRLVAINAMYIYSDRFANLSRYGINEKEIILKKHVDTKKCVNRTGYLKTQKKRFINKIIPIKGGK